MSSPMSLFESQLSSPLSALRMDAMRKLSLVSEALGPEESCKELIPFLR